MNPFGNFQFNQYQQQFAPLPAQDIIKTGELMNQEYFKNQALMDKTQQAIDSISVFDEDAGVKKEQLESYQRTLQSIMDNGGGFEMAGEAARNLARQVAKNKQLSSAASNYKQYQALMEEADKMDASDYQTAKVRALRDNYKGVGLKDEFGKYKNIGSVDFYKEHDIMKEVSDFLKGAKASQTVTMTDDGYWKVKGTSEVLTEQELMQYGFNMVAKNPKYRRQMQDMARFRASDGDLTNEITSEQFSNAYNTIAKELVSPAAGAYSYFKNNLDYKADPVLTHIAKKDIDAAADANVINLPVIDTPDFTGEGLQTEVEATYKELKAAEKAVEKNPNSSQAIKTKKDLEEKLKTQQARADELLQGEADKINESYGLKGDAQITTQDLKIYYTNLDKMTIGSGRTGFGSRPSWMIGTDDGVEKTEKRKEGRHGSYNGLYETAKDANGKYMRDEKGNPLSKISYINKFQKKIKKNYYEGFDKEISPTSVTLPTRLSKNLAQTFNGQEFTSISAYELDGTKLELITGKDKVKIDSNIKPSLTTSKIPTRSGEENMVVLGVLDEDNNPRKVYVPLSKFGGSFGAEIQGQLFKQAEQVSSASQYSTNPFEVARNEEVLMNSLSILDPSVGANFNALTNAGRSLDQRRKTGDVSYSETTLTGDPYNESGGFIQSQVGPIEDKNMEYRFTNSDNGEEYTLTKSNDQKGSSFGFLDGLSNHLFGKDSNIPNNQANAQLAIGITSYENAINRIDSVEKDVNGRSNSYLIAKLNSGEPLTAIEAKQFANVVQAMKSTGSENVKGLNLVTEDIENITREEIQKLNREADKYSAYFIELIDQTAIKEYERYNEQQ